MKSTYNQYFGLKSEIPNSMNEGSIYICIDTNEIYIYGESKSPKEIGTKNISYSTSEVKTSGTWINGKSIYRKTQLTNEAIPFNMETTFSSEVIGAYTCYKYTKTTD